MSYVPKTKDQIEEAMRRLRRMILTDGIPGDEVSWGCELQLLAFGAGSVG